MPGNIFEVALGHESLFVERAIFDARHTPSNLPHRNVQIEAMVLNLVDALRGHIPSNMILYGATGSGKTAVSRHVLNQLSEQASELDRRVHSHEVNCRHINTRYRILQSIATSLEQHGDHTIPFTGWPADRVLTEMLDRMERLGGVHVIVLDEVDLLTGPSGDSLLYDLTSLNTLLSRARCSLIGISNDLRFVEGLPASVRSRLAHEDIVFDPYDSAQIHDILSQRAHKGLQQNVLEQGVLRLCSALAAQEHGDARRALELLKASVQKAEHDSSKTVTVAHMRAAQHQLEFDQIGAIIRTLPLHQKLVLLAVLINERNGLKAVSTGLVCETYRQATKHMRLEPLTNRRISSLLNDLDQIGLLTARNVSLGRGGRTKLVVSRIPVGINAVKVMVSEDPLLQDAAEARYRVQGSL
jgi:cell division control protein 6